MRLLIRKRPALLALALMLLAAVVTLIPPDAFAQNPPRPARAAPARTTPAQSPALTTGGGAMPNVPPASRANVPAGAIASVRVEGNQRIEEGTIRSYMLVQPGDPFDPERLDRSLKTLYATGLFSDVTITRDGSALVVKVVENPVVNQVAFEGNKKLTDANLREIVQLKARSVFTPAVAQADRQRILDMYARRGRFGATVEPKIIPLDQNRVNVVFEINDGDTTLISRIIFVGNKAFGERKLNEVISSREQAWWRILSSSDTYDPDRLNYDKELLRRFYLRNGFADFKVVGATAELSPDKTAFFLTFTIDEGERYRVNKVEVKSTLRGVDAESLRSDIEIDEGDWYDGDAVERVVQALTNSVQNRGIPFVEVKPQVVRDPKEHTITLVFEVNEGPRVFIERIDITGNTRTKDKVIRREFRVAEGDAFNAALLRRSRQRLQDLDYFSNVDVQPVPGSAPDRAVVQTRVDEKATGELTLGGGYSTDIGALLSAGLRERNLIGTGVDANLQGVLAQKESQVNLSVTDPYFLDRNMVAGFDLFHIQNNLQNVAQYNERRTGFALRLGYEFTEHLRQVWTYTLAQRDVYDVQSNASIYVQNAAGITLLSQISQVMTLDYRDSRLDPHSGFVIRGGNDYAGLGGNVDFLRSKLDGAYYIPLERIMGSPEWVIGINAGIGYLWPLQGQQEQIIDRFFLGGDNLRGFQIGGAGPHATTGDSLGGRFLWTQSTELRFPLPISPDLGLSGRTFVDIGGLTQVSTLMQNGQPVPLVDYASPRVGVGVGISWKTPFGLLNIDIADAVVKKPYDKTQVFRFGFGTRF